MGQKRSFAIRILDMKKREEIRAAMEHYQLNYGKAYFPSQIITSKWEMLKMCK